MSGADGFTWKISCLRLSFCAGLVDVFRLLRFANAQQFTNPPKERHQHKLAFGNVGFGVCGRRAGILVYEPRGLARVRVSRSIGVFVRATGRRHGAYLSRWKKERRSPQALTERRILLRCSPQPNSRLCL